MLGHTILLMKTRTFGETWLTVPRLANIIDMGFAGRPLPPIFVMEERTFGEAQFTVPRLAITIDMGFAGTRFGHAWPQHFAYGKADFWRNPADLASPCNYF